MINRAERCWYWRKSSHPAIRVLGTFYLLQVGCCGWIWVEKEDLQHARKWIFVVQSGNDSFEIILLPRFNPYIPTLDPREVMVLILQHLKKLGDNYDVYVNIYIYTYIHMCVLYIIIYIYDMYDIYIYTCSTVQGDGGSFQDRTL